MLQSPATLEVPLTRSKLYAFGHPQAVYDLDVQVQIFNKTIPM